jgi:hypothetical protein
VHETIIHLIHGSVFVMVLNADPVVAVDIFLNPGLRQPFMTIDSPSSSMMRVNESFKVPSVDLRHSGMWHPDKNAMDFPI